MTQLLDTYDVILGPNRNPPTGFSGAGRTAVHNGILTSTDLRGHDIQGPDWLTAHELGDFRGEGAHALALEKGDLILTVRGSTFLVAAVPEDAPKLVLGSGLARLRARPAETAWPAWPVRLMRWFLFHQWETHIRDWSALNGQIQIGKEDLRRIPLERYHRESAGDLDALVGAFVNHDRAVQEALQLRRAITMQVLAGGMA